jgi:peptide/nickel transport system substrate-binding protein
VKEIKILGNLAASGKLSRREFLGRAAALGVAAPFANTILATAVQAAGPQKGGTLKMGMVGGEATNSLDPASWASQVPYTFGRCWGETLINMAPDGGLVPVLAESWESSPDAKTWTFKIRSGVTFHDGKSLTAEDVAATLERHSGEDTKSGALGIMRGLDSIKVDGDTVILDQKGPNADLPHLLTDYHLVIQPNGGMDKPDAGIGTGAYTVSVNEPGVRHVGEKYADHWNSDVGHADSVEIIVINDSTARTAALQSGKVHMINRVEPKVVDLVKRLPGVTIENVAGRGHYVFLMHTNTAPFDNADLRMALKLAMDREAMVKTILRGYGTVGNDMPINTAYPLFSDDIPQRSYDPDKASFHFKKSGHSGKVLLRTSDVAFPGAVDAAQLYQQSAKAAGIDVEIKREPGDGYWSNVWNKQPFCQSYWGGRPVQDQMYSVAYLSTADWNDTKWNNPAFDKLLLSARGELDDVKRKELYREMGVMVRDEGGLICPMFNDFIDARTDKLAGYVQDPNGELMNGFAGIQCWLV